MKKKFIIGNTLLMLFAGLLGGLGLYFFFPTRYFLWFPVIPAYFYIFGWVYIYLFDKCVKNSPQRIHLVYMSMKVATMLLSILFILLCVLLDKEHKVESVLMFLLFYVLSLAYQTSFFYRFERKLKLNKEIKK